MNDADVIKILIAVVIAMVGAFYASFIYEMRRVRKNLHDTRNIVNQHGIRLAILEKFVGATVFEDPFE